MSILQFVFKNVYEKILEVLRLKIVYDQMELYDFKMLVNVMETQEEFIGKYVQRFVDINAEGTFLENVIENAKSKFDF